MSLPVDLLPASRFWLTAYPSLRLLRLIATDMGQVVQGALWTWRAELFKVIGRLESGDVLVVTRFDRLARSTRDLPNVIAAITERGAGFKSLRDAWADTTSPHGRLMLTVLGELADSSGKLIRARTGEGRKRAQERGVRFGRPRSAWNGAAYTFGNEFRVADLGIFLTGSDAPRSTAMFEYIGDIVPMYDAEDQGLLRVQILRHCVQLR